jgi:uncharacterized protein
MGVEVRPLGVNCNLSCQYCYQNPQRDAGNLTRKYDLQAMKDAIAAEGQPFILFGGEPLLVPVEDLEELWRFGLERFGYNGVQTNGVLIEERHLELFRRYKVHVGISMDGPGPLNDARWQGTLGATRAATERTQAAIERLCREGMPPSLIVTLHQGNAAAAHLPALSEWLRGLDRIGVQSARLHLLEVEEPSVRGKYALAAGDNVRALLCLSRLEGELARLRFDLFREIEALLLANDQHATCVWRACDPFTTEAVRGVEGHGQRSNCGRTNKDGIDFAKAAAPGYERYLALYHTPQEAGGCKGCRFFLQCKGQCPGTALGGDWRNRTEHCTEWKAVFREAEDRLLDRGATPISVQPNRRYLEAEMLRAWTEGRNPSLHEALARMIAEHASAGAAS